MTFTVTLPLPPSTNGLYVHVTPEMRARSKKRLPGRIKTKAYAKWRKAAILSIFAQVRADRRISGPVALSLCVPSDMRGDIENRLKSTIDALVAARRIDDDKHVQSITIQRGTAAKGTIEVKAEAA